MLYEILTSLSLVGLGAALEHYKDNIWDCCRAYQRITNLIRTQDTNPVVVYYKSTKLALKTLVQTYLYTHLHIVYIVDDNNQIISQSLSDVDYKIYKKLYRGPKKVIKITDERGNDITTQLLPYLGPREDFHMREYTPNFFHHDLIKITLTDDRELSFLGNDVMKI
jgi:hypothetical protein